MYINYSKYKDEDFLVDDYFIDTMLNPTSKSEKFWKELIDNKELDVDEFISAFTTLKALSENKPEVFIERMEMLWKRIENTNRIKIIKSKRLKLFSYVAVACSFIGIISFSIFTYLNISTGRSTQSITDFANENIIHTHQPNNQIQIVSGNKTLAVEGMQAKVEYDSTGKLKVNKQAVKVNNSALDVNYVPVYNQLKVPYGKRAFLTLSDGTKLWINTGSTVIYPTTFAKEKREIFIEGEVYAEVFHDAKHPFIVKTEKIDVQVLGTVFNVISYKEDKQTNVVLVSGSVNVKPNNGKQTIIKPNQLFTYTNQASTLTNVDVEKYTSWKDGIYIFSNEPIENILLRLSRYYNVTMKLPTSASGISCSGKLELKDDLTQLLNGLIEITSMNFAVKNNEYQISFQ